MSKDEKSVVYFALKLSFATGAAHQKGWGFGGWEGMPPRVGQSAFMTLPSTLALMKVAADVGGSVESKWGGPGLWGRWTKPAQFICFCCISSFDLQTREENDSEAGNSCRLCPPDSCLPSPA